MTQSVGKKIEFWFDFSSPYAYFAALQIDDIALRYDRVVVWRPFLLHVALKQTGMAPLIDQPMRGNYAVHDWERMAREHQVAYRIPAKFPLLTVTPARMFYAIENRNAPDANGWGLALFKALFERGVDITEPASAAKIGAELGLPEQYLIQAATDPTWRRVLRERTDEALAKGVFGSPFFIIDGEGFWGADRLTMIDCWLATGGW